MRALILFLTSLFLLTGCVLMKNVREVQEGNVFYSKIPKLKLKIDPSMKYIDKPKHVYHNVSCKVHLTYYLFYDAQKQTGVLIILDNIGGNCGYASGSHKLTRDSGKDDKTEYLFKYWEEIDFPSIIRWVRLSKKLSPKDKMDIIYFEPIGLKKSNLYRRCDQAITILEPKT